MFFKFQLTGVFPIERRNSLAFENGFEPKNLVTEKGEGCALLITQWRFLSMSDSFCWAKLPHRTNAQPELFSEMTLMTLSVNLSQPIFECEPALCALQLHQIKPIFIYTEQHFEYLLYG